MDLELTGKVAIVTGASRGIGRAVALRLAAEGMRVAVAARDAAALATLDAALAHAADLREPDAPGALVEATVARFGRLDLVVNNAGATVRGDFLALDDAAWADGFALKLFGAVRLCRAAWPHLARSGGTIVNVAGTGGRTASAEFTIGGAVNAALMNFTKALADRGVADGVRVVAINPGYVRTDRLAGRIAKRAAAERISEDAAMRALGAESGLARFGEPQEVADVVAFLASARASYVQGAIVDVDGGLTRAV